MYFGLLPPEINSGRMYTGPGSGPMLAAAEAWDGLAIQLHATAASYSSVLSGVRASWQGPSSVVMATAAGPYIAWMSATAGQAEQTAAQARAAATAYEAAFAATVPPAVVAANRSELVWLVATNVFGQNTPAIAANEAQYSQMWARDAAAMYGYANQSAAATTVQPFTSPPATIHPTGATSQAAAVAQAAGVSAGRVQQALSHLVSAVPQTLQSAAAPSSPLSLLLNELSNITSPSSPLTQLLGYYETEGKAVLIANNALVSNIMGFGLSARGFRTGVLPVAPAALSGQASGLAAGLASGTHLTTPAGAEVSAGIGHAGLVGGMSVPPGWATATPAIRTVAAVLSGAGAGAVPAAAVSEGTLLSGMALGGMAGSALGAAVPGSLGGAGARLRSTSLKDGSPKDGETPANLQRLVAEMADKPDDVQHWYTESADLESLVARLRKKPGIHAVHLTDGDMNVKLPRPDG